MVGPGWLSVLYTVVDALFFLFSEYYLKLAKLLKLKSEEFYLESLNVIKSIVCHT